MASPPSSGGRRQEKGHAAAASSPARPDLGNRLHHGRSDGGPEGWWWTAVSGVVAVGALLASALGPLDPPAAAVVIGAAVVSAGGRPRGAAALAAVGVLAGITVAALLEEPAPLAGVAVAGAAVQLALSPRGQLRLVATGLLVATVAGALALRAAEPPSVGGRVDGATALILAAAALAVALLALPARGGAAAVPTAAVACAALTISALGAEDVGIGLAAAGVVAALGLGLARRPAAALVAAALACLATPAASAAPLALAAAAVAAVLAVPWSHRATPEMGGPSDAQVSVRPRAWGLPGSAGSDAEVAPTAAETVGHDPDGAAGPSISPGGSEGSAANVRWWTPPAWLPAVAALPAGAGALDAAAGRSASSVLAVTALAVAVGVPILLDRAGGERPVSLPLAAWPAAGLAVLTLVLPGRVGWLGDPLPHWSAGVGCAAIGAALAILPLRRSGHSTSDAPPTSASTSASASKPDLIDDQGPAGPLRGSAMGPGPVVPGPEPQGRRWKRRKER